MAHYNWSTGDTTQTIVIPVTGPVNVTLTCIDSLGMIWQRCPDPAFTWGVVPAPTPFSLTLLTDDTLCTNQTFQALIPVQAGAVAQVFSDGYPGVLNNNLLTLNFYQQYTNYIIVKLFNVSNYCTTFANDTIHVLFTSPLDSNQTPLVNGNYITVGDTVPNVQWYLDGVAIPWANSDTLYMGSIGCYSYEAWNLDRDCSVMSTEYCQTVTTSSAAENNLQLKVYPNPNEGNFTVVSMDEKLANPTIFITDITGRNIPFELIMLDEHTMQIDAKSLASGIYNLRLNGKTVKIFRF